MKKQEKTNVMRVLDLKKAAKAAGENILEEQRETNRLLRELIENLER